MINTAKERRKNPMEFKKEMFEEPEMEVVELDKVDVFTSTLPPILPPDD